MTATSALCTVEVMHRYRAQAAEALNLAQPCEDEELRKAYLSIASRSFELADKIERLLREPPSRQ